MTQLTYERFISCLRSALHYLYDPDQLRRSPLAALLGVANRIDTPSALQHILTEAIEALRPAADEPPQSRAWRIYDALSFRYVRCLDRETVANQLGISGRQLRREQRAALEALAVRLWQQFGPAAEPGSGSAPGAPAVPDPGAVTAREAGPDWLRDVPPGKPADLRQVLQAALELARPLAQERAVALASELAEPLPDLAVPQVVLRHALLNLLSIAIPRVPGGQVRLATRLAGDEVEVTVGCLGHADAASPLSESDNASLAMAQQLAGLCGGRLRLAGDATAFAATLALPVLRQVRVLVIDDNADVLQLFQRYASGTRYTVIGTRESGGVLSLVEGYAPQVIVLDVMMPEVDGWELLAQLRRHPLASQVPIVVCSILPQEALARPLGADAFLQKPVTRQALLRALDEMVQPRAPEGRNHKGARAPS